MPPIITGSYIMQHRTESTFILHSGCEFRAVFTILPACTASWNGIFFFFLFSPLFRAKEDLRRDFCSVSLASRVSEGISCSLPFLQGRKHVPLPLQICSARTLLLVILANL